MDVELTVEGKYRTMSVYESGDGSGGGAWDKAVE